MYFARSASFIRVLATLVVTSAYTSLSFAQPSDEQEAAPVSFLSKNLIIPPAPDAASLGQYGNIPVSLYNGRINLSIPLYTIMGKELSLPISLSYSSGGIKVSEDNGWIGLGWTLNAGGVITRSVFGRPDDCESYYNKKSIIEQGVAGLNQRQQQDHFLRLLEGEIETQPDPYFYNLPGQSGKFFINLDKQAVLIDHQPLEVSFSNLCNNETAMTIKGSDGTTYVFGDRELTTLQYDDESPASSLTWYEFVSSWYLSEMISASGLDTIFFEYEGTLSIPMVVNPESESISYTVHGPTTNPPSGSYTPACGQVGNSQGAGATTSIARKYLHKIKYRDTEVTFHSVTDITSAFGGRKIDYIQVLIDSVQSRKFDFQQSYFESSSELNDARLRLDSIVEFGQNDQVAPPYEFEYESQVLLPSIHSKSVDHWGFYNGSGNTSLIPNLVNGSCTLGNAADRETSEDNVKAGSIKKIKYPTGGFTEFEFGPHRKVTTHAGTSKEVVETGHNASALVLGGLYGSGQTCNGQPRFTVVDFAVPDTVTRFSIDPPGNVWNEQQNGEGSKVFAGIINTENFDFTGCDLWGYVTTHLPDFQYYWFLEEDAWPQSVPNELIPGNYKLIALSADPAESIVIEATYFVMELRQIEVSEHEQLVGGLRVERITDFAASGQIASIKQYEYEEGRTFGDPAYFSLSSYFFEAPRDQDGDTESTLLDYNSFTLSLSSSSRSSLGSVLGSHVGYGRVTERFLDASSNSNGYKTYVYRNNQLPEAGSTFGYDMNDFGQGDLINESIYDKYGHLVRETINEYAFDIADTRYSPSLQGTIAYARPHQSNRLTLAEVNAALGTYQWIYPVNDDEFGAFSLTERKIYKVDNQSTSYFLFGHWQYLSKSTVRDSTITGELETVTEYVYDSPLHAQATRISRKNSAGEEILTTLRYPSDGVAGLSSQASQALDDLVSRHVFTTPIEKILFVKDSIHDAVSTAQAQRTDYALVNGMPFPSDVYIAESTELFAFGTLDDKYKARAKYQYDSNGDVVRYAKTNDIVQSFIWSSDHRSVIAEVTGADVSAVAFTSFEESDKGGWTFNGSTVDPSNNILHTGKQYYNLTTGSISHAGLASASTYVVSFYYGPSASVSVSGGTVTTLVSYAIAGGWTFKSVAVTGATSVSVSGTGALDDLRLHPAGALMTTYTHDPIVGVVATMDANCITTFFEYDDAGRLVRTRDNLKNIVKEVKYHYKGQ